MLVLKDHGHVITRGSFPVDLLCYFLFSLEMYSCIKITMELIFYSAPLTILRLVIVPFFGVLVIFLIECSGQSNIVKGWIRVNWNAEAGKMSKLTH